MKCTPLHLPFLSSLVGVKEKSCSLNAANVSATNIHIKVQLHAFKMCGIPIVLPEHIIKEKEPINMQLYCSNYK